MLVQCRECQLSFQTVDWKFPCFDSASKITIGIRQYLLSVTNVRTDFFSQSIEKIYIKGRNGLRLTLEDSDFRTKISIYGGKC